eukprot:gene14756-59506_t
MGYLGGKMANIESQCNSLTSNESAIRTDMSKTRADINQTKSDLKGYTDRYLQLTQSIKQNVDSQGQL